MLQKWLSSLRRPSGSAANFRSASSPANAAVLNAAVASLAQPPAYPPVDRGLPISTAQGLLASNAELVSRLRLHAATESATFQERFEIPLLNLAEQINSLPATASGLFAGEGGLFRASMEMAFYSFQAADGRIFTGTETVERRHALEGRWRYVCFLAGMFYPLGKALDCILVTSAGGETWRRHFGGLTDWATSKGIDRVFTTWPNVDEDTQEIGPSSHIAAMIATVVGSANLQWLEDGSPELVKALYEISSGNSTNARNCRDVVLSIWERIQRREEARRPQAFGRQTVGTHLGPYLVGAIRSLLATPEWKLNGERVKADSSGLYLMWPRAIEDIARFGKQEGYQGWPGSAATIAELLKSCQVVLPFGEDLGMVEVVSDSGEILKALKIKNPLSVLEEFDPESFANAMPKTLKGLIEADPLVDAEVAAERKGQVAAIGPATEVVDPVPKEQRRESTLGHQTEPVQAELGSSEQSDTDDVSKIRQEESQEPTPSDIPDSGLERTEDVQPQPLREAAEVRYSDLVPQDVQKDIKKRLHVELLGKVMKAWRDRGEGSKSMRMTDNGAAITVEMLATLVRDVPGWVGEMAAAGLIYSPPSTPGLKIIKVAIPEGSKPKESIVLSRFAVKKLGL